MKRAAIFAYSKQGCRTAENIKTALENMGISSSCYTIKRLCGENASFSMIASPSSEFYGKLFHESDALIFVSSCGIAIRAIAQFVKDKTTDPAVIAVDELSRFTVPLLSGHIGGANRLASALSNKLDSTAVITTATDINGRFSIDAWAANGGYAIADMHTAKLVSAAILEHDIPIKSDFPINGELPHGLIFGDSGMIGIWITPRGGDALPFETTLRLIPRSLCVGIGCRRGIEGDRIEAAVDTVFKDNSLDVRAIACVSSIDIKKDEAGLIEYCDKHGYNIKFHSSDELKTANGEFQPSEFVKTVTGVDNVCERAAALESERILVHKTAVNGVTVAVGIIKTEVCFE